MRSSETNDQLKRLSFVITRTDHFDGTHKSEIYSHIAKETHRKRRQRQSRRAIEREESSISSSSSLSDDSSCLVRHFAIPVSALYCREHLYSFDSGCDECFSIQHTIQCTTSSSLAHYGGNGDPFNSQAIEIDAQAGYYLDIGFNCIDIHPFETGLWAHSLPRGKVARPKPPAERRSLLDFPPCNIVSGREPEKTTSHWSSAFAYAVLANYAGYLFALSEDIKHLDNATEYTGRCMRDLGNYLAESQSQNQFGAEYLIFRLLRAELATQSFTTALTHAIYLKEIVERRISHGAVDLSLVYHALYTSNQLAFAFWTRSLYQASWVRDTFQLDWLQCHEIDLSLEPFRAQLLRFTAREDLCELLSSTKSLFLQTSTYLRDDMHRSGTKWYALQSRGEWLQMSLFNIVLEEEDKATLRLARRQTENGGPCGTDKFSHAVAESVAVDINICLALVGILSIRFKSQDPVLNDRPLSPLMSIILNKLSATFIRLDMTMVAESDDRFHGALLWVSLVAAIVEHRHRDTLAKQDVSGVSDASIKGF
ncbi:hypothetical protein H2200_008707 [Cladophialophora chaetospira]|uniref:Transcription factor domain-containing protein n=1 Tax=Cladophialophora chaetospira TaxID=386627 RepID=A0AA39CFU9_9EURO|nr:hypothetical protein H2200_008707 [Cladophialophora chaetospira]